MQQKKIYFLILTLITIFDFNCVKNIHTLNKYTNSNILGYIGNETLTMDDFLQFIQLDKHALAKNIEPEYINDLFNDYLTIKLIVKHAKNIGLDQSSEFKRNVENFKTELLFNLFNKQIQDQIQIPTDTECLAYFKKNRSLFTTPDKVYIKHLLFSDKAKAEKLLVKIKTPIDFEKVMKEQLQNNKALGGDIGFVTLGMLDKNFEKEVLKMQKNEISGIIKSKFGYHIALCYKVEKGRTQEFSDIKNDLREELYKERIEQKMKNLLSKIKKSNNVHIKSSYLKNIITKLKHQK